MGEQMFNCRDVEDHLAPFVDGADAPDTARAVEAHLKRCPPCADRAEHERLSRDLLAANRDALGAKAPAALRERCRQQLTASSLQPPASSVQPSASGVQRAASGVRWRRIVPMSVAASLLLAVAVVFLFGINNRVEALTAGLALDHVKCFTIGDSDHALDAHVAEQAWARDKGWPIQVAHADADEQLELVSVRRCLSMDGATAHVMYRWRGAPLSVYVLPHTVAESRVVDAMGHETAIWSREGRTYAVMTDGHPAGFDHIVSYVKDHTR